MESLDVTFRLLDRMTPTLDVMDRHLAATRNSLGDVDRALRTLDRAEKQARFANERDPMRRYRVGLELMKERLGDAGAGMNAAGASAGGLGIAIGVVTAVATKAIDAVTALAAATASLAVRTTAFAIESASFKRDTMMAFELIEGGADGARDSFERLVHMADRTPFRTSEVLTFGKTLRATGFTLRETEDLLAGVFDVAALAGKEGPEKARGLVEAITKIKGRDVLNIETMEQLVTNGGAAGLNLGNILGVIAKERRITLTQARALMHSGDIHGIEGIRAVLGTIREQTDKGGPLGKATLDFGTKSLEGQLSTLSSRFASLFYDLDIQPLVDILVRVNELLSAGSPTGKRIRAFANDLLGKMFARASELLTTENLEKALDLVADAATAVGDSCRSAGPLLTSFVEGIGAGFDSIPGKVNPVAEVLRGLKLAIDTESPTMWREFGEAIGRFVGVMVALGRALQFLHDHGLAPMRTTLGQIASVVPGLGGLALAAGVLPTGSGRARVRQPTSFQRGTDVGGGFADGLTDAAAGVNFAATALADGSVKAIEDRLQIHSPSRVMMGLGANAGEGFSEGIERSDARAALAQLVAPKAPSGGGPARPAARSGGITISFGDIVVTASPGDTPAGAARAVRERVRAELLALFDEMGLA